MRFSASLFLIFACGFITPLTARAQTIQGTWVLDAGASDTMEEIVADALTKVNAAYRLPIIRGVAERRLRETNAPYPWMRIEMLGDSVEVRSPSWTLTSPRNGSVEDWRPGNGEGIDVTTRMAKGELVQTFQAQDGSRVNDISLSAGGDLLTMKVTVASPKLSEPLHYRLVFRRRV
jgi:hypothetical protein